MKNVIILEDFKLTMGASTHSKVINWFLKKSKFKKTFEVKSSKTIFRRKKNFLPKYIQLKYVYRHQIFKNKSIVTFNNKKQSKNHVLFLHGGAYIFEATLSHWLLAEKIAKKSFSKMTMIDYPLAPEHGYKETLAMVSGAYDLLRKQYPNDHLILMGDSAGGGLVLAFTQKLIKEKYPYIPQKLILLSPWLDLSMSNPDIAELESRDYILSRKMLENAATGYANGDPMNHYLLSPINGELEKLPPTLLFYGTEELLYADCIKLKKIAAAKNAPIIFREYKNMQHEWVLFPIPERNQVINEIVDFI